MSQFLQASNSIKLTKNINLSAATVSGVSIEMGAHNEGHITTVNGAQYALTDATTGRILYPRRIVRVKKNLDITLLDGTKVQLVDFFISEEGQTSVLRAQAEFVFSTVENGRLQHWRIAEDSIAFNASAGPSITLWSSDFAMSTVQWSAVVPYTSFVPTSDALLAVPTLGSWGGLGSLFASGAGLLGATAIAADKKPQAPTAESNALELEGEKPVTEAKRYVIEGTIGAGPVLASNDLMVTLYDETGKVIGTDRGVDVGGKYSIELPFNFVGQFTVKVTSTATNADYQDEVTKEATDLGGFTLSAVSYSSGGKNVTANISPLTDLAARKLTSGDSLKTALLDSDIQTINRAIAKEFLGVPSGDITTQEIQFTVNAAGQELETSNRYAQVLKQLSVVAATNGGNVETAQAAVESSITWQPGQSATEAVFTGEASKIAVVAIFAANKAAEAANEVLRPLSTLTSSQAAAITPDQLSKLMPTNLAILPPEAVAALPTQALAALTDTQVATLMSAQLAALTQAQMAAMAKAGNLDNLSPAQVIALPVTTIDALPAALLVALTDTQVATLTPAQLAALTQAQMAAIALAGNLDNLSPAQVIALPVTTIGLLPAAVLVALTDTQVATLTPAQLAALTQAQMAAMAVAGNLDNVSPAQVIASPATSIDALPASVLAALTDSQVATLTQAQLGALTTPQKIAMVASGNLDNLTNEQILILAPGNRAAVTGIMDDQGSITGLVFSGGSTNDNTLMVGGTLASVLSPGESVRIYDGTAFLGTASVNASGTAWTFNDSRELNHAQTVNYSARVTNAAGIQSPAGSVYTATVDTSVADAASLTLSLDPSGNSGSSSVQLTRMTSPAMTVGNLQGKSFVAGDVIQIVNTNSQNSVLGSYTVVATDLNAAGQWLGTSQAISASNLAEGVNSMTVRVMDSVGNISIGRVPLSVTVDGQLPMVSAVGITSASGIFNKTLNAGDIAHISVSLTEPVNVTGLPQLTLIIGNSEVQAQYNASSSTSTRLVFDYTVVLADHDSAGIAIKANSLMLNGGSITDPANNPATLGHVGVPGNTNYLVNSNAPTLTLNAVAGDNQVNASDKAASVTLSGLTNAEEGQTVTVRWGGVSQSTQVTSGAWQVNVASADIPADGPAIAIVVSVADLAGNAKQISQDVLIDTVVPTVAFKNHLTSGAGVLGDVDNLLNAAELQLIKADGHWLVEGTSNGAQNNQDVWITLNGQTFSGKVSANVNPNTWQVQVSSAEVQALVHGNSYTLTVVVSDAAGNVAMPASANLQVRLAPPDIPTVNLVNTNSLAPTLGGGIQKESSPGTFVYIPLESGDAFSVTVGSQTYSLTLGAGAVSSNGPLTYNTSSKSWSLVLPVGVINAEGGYDVAVSVNAAGYTTPKVDISSNELVIKTTPPVITIDVVSGDGRLNAMEHSGGVTLSGTVTDQLSGGAINTAVGRSLSVNLNGHAYTATVQLDGSWNTVVSATDIQTLSDGNEVVNVSYTGFYGNAAVASRTIMVDTLAPSLSLTTPADLLLSAPELTAFSMVYSSTDSLETPVVSVQIVNAFNVVQTAVGLSIVGNLISGDLSSLSDGVYTLQVSSSDGVGNVSTRSQSLTIDASAPTANIVMAESALKVGETSLVTISFSEAVTGFSNNNLTVPNGTLSTLASTDNGLTWTGIFTPTSNVESTSNVLRLVGNFSDLAGNSNTAASSGNFSVDTRAPAAPVFNGVAIDNTINATEQTTTLTGTNEAGATVTLGIGVNSRVATVNGTVWSYTLVPADLTALGQGAKTLSAMQTDAAGNVSTANTLVINVDTSPPAAPVINTVATDDIIGGSEQNATLTGTNDSGATVALNIGGNTREAVVSGTTWSYTLTPADITAMAEGAETLSVTQTDEAGNISTVVTKTITVATLVNGAPTFDPVATDNIINASEQNAILTGTNVNGATVTLNIGGNTRAAVVNGTTWSYTLVPEDMTAMGQGFETLSATQSDAAANVSDASLKTIVVDTTPPARPVILAVATDDTINASEQTTTLTGSNTSGATVVLSIAGNTRVATVTGTTWRYTLTPADIVAMGEGSETLSAVQSDLAGNAGAVDTRVIAVDTVVPSAPMINVVATDDTIDAVEETTTTLTGTNESGTSVSLNIGGNTRVAVVNGATWSYTLVAADISAMGHGAETLSATQTDAAGNVSAADTRAIMLNDAPTLTSVTALTGFTEDTFKDITYVNLLAAANEADLNGEAISFRVETISSGTLEKRNSSNTAWIPVVAGTTTLATGERLHWKAAQNANGSSVNAFTVKAFDGLQYSATAVQVSTVVAAVNDVLTLTSVTALTGFTEDTFTDITYADLFAAANVGNVDGDPISFRVEAVSTGTLEKRNSSDTAWVAVVAGTTTLALGEKLQWKGAQNASSSQNLFTVKAFDGTAYSATAVQVSATVAPVNDTPVLTAGTLTAVSALEDSHNTTATSLGLSALTYGPGGGSDEGIQILTYAIATIPSFMSLWLLDGVTQVTSATTGLSQADLQGLQFKTLADAVGTGNLTWTVTDSANPQETLTQSLSVTVTAVNDAPTAQDVTLTMNEDDSKVLAVTDFGFADALDNPPNALSAVILLGLPALGMLKLGTALVTQGQSITAADIAAGLLTYTPAANGSGTAYTSIDFRVQDDGGVLNNGVDISAAKTLTFNVLVDTFIADVTSATLDLKTSSDSGADNTDNLTNVQLPTVTVSTLNGKAFQAGDVIQILDASNANAIVGSYSVLSTDLTGGIWHGTSQDISLTSSLAAGVHALRVKTLDAAGNTSSSTSSLGITVDTTPPNFLRLPTAGANSNVFDVQWSSSMATNTKPGQIAFSSNLGDFTVASWMRYDLGSNAGSWQALFGSSNLTSGLLAVDNHNELYLAGAYLGGSLTSNAWVHIAVTVSNNTATLYVNGVSRGSNSVTLAAGNTSIYLGSKGSAGGAAEIFSGDFSQLKVYDRVLTATEVNVAKNSTNSTDANLVAYFDPQSLTPGAVSSVSNKVAGGPVLTLQSVNVAGSSTFNGPLLSRLDLVAASDTGGSTTDNITTDDTPTISIINVNGLQLVVGDSFQLIDTSNNNAVLATRTALTADLTNGAWSVGNFPLTATALSLSVHNLKVILVDAAGNQVTGGGVLSVDIRATAPPVTLDLNGDGRIHYTTATLDINLDGQLDRSGWVAAEDGLLFHNKFGDGSLRETGQYQFAQTKGQTDLQGLAEVFDSNQDGWLSAQDARFNEFSAWSDQNQDGKVDPGELRSLQDLGIESIHLVHEAEGSKGNAQVTVHGDTSANLTNGTKMLVQDASFLYQHAVL